MAIPIASGVVLRFRRFRRPRTHPAPPVIVDRTRLVAVVAWLLSKTVASRESANHVRMRLGGSTRRTPRDIPARWTLYPRAKPRDPTRPCQVLEDRPHRGSRLQHCSRFDGSVANFLGSHFWYDRL